MNARKLTFFCAPAAMLLLSGCHMEGWADSQRFTEDFRQSHSLSPGGRLTIENFNGSIEIYGWDKNEVEINGTKYASTKDALEEIRIEVSAKPDSVEIRTVRPSIAGRRWGNSGAKYRIHVPVKTQLSQVVSSNGSVRLDSLEGNGVIRTSNGAVRAMKYRGNLRINTSNGGVEMSDCTGEAQVETSNGRVKVDGATAALNVTSTNGSVSARLVGPKAHGAKLRTSNGAVDLAIDAPLDGEVEAHTSNGAITLRLPSAANARIRAHTSNSSITTDFDLNAVQLKKRTDLEGTIGSGGPLIDLSTSNGSIKIQRN
ncbi:MAG: DUF4097 family beta strand repeat-containing protein [Bryobacteraceae bacterium]